MRILIINGSHRNGNTDKAIDRVKLVLEQNNHTVRELRLREIEMKLPDGCEACAESKLCPNIHDQFSQNIEPAIRDYDAYIIATPTWDDGVTPLTKIFWDRIVSWCAPERMYLRGKKIAVVTHGMAGGKSWKHVVNWVKSICVWEEAQFYGALTFSSGSKPGDLSLSEKKINAFLNKPTL